MHNNPERHKEYQRQYYTKHKQYYVDRAIKRRQDIRSWIDQHKQQLSCMCCPENEPCCLDFHHCDGSKDFGISYAVRMGLSIKRIEQEIAKCKVLCSNCHRKVHAGILNI